MWCDELPPDTSWTVLWRNLIICGHCSGIRSADNDCPACGSPMPVSTRRMRLGDGREVPMSIFMGAEGRYEDYVYLKMMEREWKRPILESDQFLEIALEERPSPRAAIVLLFWAYFETRIERLLRKGMKDIPDGLLEDTLRRYSFIGQRLDRLYKIIFGMTYLEDLAQLGYMNIAAHLSEIQQRRNEFTHGNPKAIDDALVVSVIKNLKIEHEAWLSVFNKRTAKPNS